HPSPARARCDSSHRQSGACDGSLSMALPGRDPVAQGQRNAPVGSADGVQRGTRWVAAARLQGDGHLPGDCCVPWLLEIHSSETAGGKMTIRNNRREFVKQSALLLTGLYASPWLTFASADAGSVVATTSAGRVRGTMSERINIFKGIPYGASTA